MCGKNLSHILIRDKKGNNDRKQPTTYLDAETTERHLATFDECQKHCTMCVHNAYTVDINEIDFNDYLHCEEQKIADI